MSTHICKAPTQCICKIDAIDKLCPKHGVPKKPTRCVYCNKFMGVDKPISLVDFFKMPKEMK